MTWEEAIKFADHAVNMTDIPEVKEFYRMCASSLRPVRREQVEKVWRGEWEVDEFGHKCSKCGEYLPSGDDDIFPQFCPNCGDAKTDEAVEMVMENLEALNEM